MTLSQAHMDAARVWMETGFIPAPLARDPAVLSFIRELHKEEIRKERERCAHEVASVSMSAMLLAAGDMTAGERRTVRAVQSMFVEMLLRGDA